MSRRLQCARRARVLQSPAGDYFARRTTFLALPRALCDLLAPARFLVDLRTVLRAVLLEDFALRELLVFRVVAMFDNLLLSCGRLFRPTATSLGALKGEATRILRCRG